MRVVAILETMWDWRGITSDAGYHQAPRYFRINKDNYSGRRLYKLVGPDVRLLVTNACRELATSAKGHGKPDPEWLAENLQKLENIDRPFNLLLVCGKVAQGAYKKCGYTPAQANVLEIPHPAARTHWTRPTIKETSIRIQEILFDQLDT